MKHKKKRISAMDLILVVIFITTIIFIATMIWLFIIHEAIPDTLCTCYFATIGGECGVMGWIKTTKERKRERKYEIEDRNDNSIGFKDRGEDDDR